MTAVCLRAWYAMSGTEVAYGRVSLRALTTRCPVLTYGMVLWLPSAYALLQDLQYSYTAVTVVNSALYVYGGETATVATGGTCNGKRRFLRKRQAASGIQDSWF
eukprot:2083018-Rhodomonas_salina.1